MLLFWTRIFRSRKAAVGCVSEGCQARPLPLGVVQGAPDTRLAHHRRKSATTTASQVRPVAWAARAQQDDQIGSGNPFDGAPAAALRAYRSMVGACG